MRFLIISGASFMINYFDKPLSSSFIIDKRLKNGLRPMNLMLSILFLSMISLRYILNKVSKIHAYN